MFSWLKNKERETVVLRAGCMWFVVTLQREIICLCQLHISQRKVWVLSYQTR